MTRWMWLAQVRDNEEYGVADLDHYYEFLGGLSSSIEAVENQELLQSLPSAHSCWWQAQPGTGSRRADLKTALNYEVRTKLLNPAWMKGQMDSGYKGVKNLSKRMEHLIGWQATASGSVDSWVWSEMADTYVFNEEVRKTMMKENIWAVEDQLRRLMEAYRAGHVGCNRG